MLYDAATGKVLAEGEFRNGVLLTPKAELDAGKNPTEPETAAKEPETETAAVESESAPRRRRKQEIPQRKMKRRQRAQLHRYLEGQRERASVRAMRIK